MTWYSMDPFDTGQLRLQAAWPDAPTTNGDLCSQLLSVARQQVIEYAPALAPGEEYDEATLTRYAWAQLQQAKSLWNAGRVAPGTGVGGDFQFVPRPLDTEIRAIIRPKRGVPNVF